MRKIAFYTSLLISHGAALILYIIINLGDSHRSPLGAGELFVRDLPQFIVIDLAFSLATVFIVVGIATIVEFQKKAELAKMMTINNSIHNHSAKL